MAIFNCYVKLPEDIRVYYSDYIVTIVAVGPSPQMKLYSAGNIIFMWVEQGELVSTLR